jgi:hypothetical protein
MFDGEWRERQREAETHMRTLTILAALILAAAGGAYGALIASGGGSAVGEPYVVVPVKPQPLKSPDILPVAPMAAPAAPFTVQPTASSGPVTAPAASATPVAAQVAAPAAASVPGLSIDIRAGQAPRLPPARQAPGLAPAGLGARPAGG